MQNSSIGLLLFKDSANPIQYFPLSRALACFKDIQNILPLSSITKLETLTKSIAIPDPKQVNPLGMIELELFFENLLEEHEFLIKDIVSNCSELFKVVINNKLNKDLFIKMTQKLTQKDFYESESENVIQTLNKVEEISLNYAIEIACKVCGFTSENILNYLDDLLNLSIIEAKNLILNKLALNTSEISAKLLENIEDIDIKHALVWMKILTEE